MAEMLLRPQRWRRTRSEHSGCLFASPPTRPLLTLQPKLWRFSLITKIMCAWCMLMTNSHDLQLRLKWWAGAQKISQSSESISCRANPCQESACCCCALQLQHSASSFCEHINSCANQILTSGNTLLGDGEMEKLVMCHINRDCSMPSCCNWRLNCVAA